MAKLQQVVFKLDNEEYGLDIMKVNGIERYQEVIKVPNTPDYVEGMINLRDEVLPIFNLRKKFKLVEKAKDDETMIIVVYTEGIKVGFIVDSVMEIIEINEEDVEEAPTIVAGVNRRYIQSVAKLEGRMIILMDIDLLVTDEEKITLGKVVEEA